MQKYIFQRLLLTIPTLFIITVVTFVGLRVVIPANVVDVILGEYGRDNPELKGRLEKELGLSASVPEQYADWIGLSWFWGGDRGILQGNLGSSLRDHRPVVTELKRRVPVSFELGFWGQITAVIASIPMGVFAAVRQDQWPDYGLRSFGILLAALPNFWIAIVIITFGSLWFNWAPPLRFAYIQNDPVAHFKIMLMPALIIGLTPSGGLIRLVRTQMLEVLRQDYVRTARAKGLSQNTVLYKHALRNALIPVVTVIGVGIPGIISGTVLFEQIFAIPGMGRYLVSAIANLDYPVIQGVILVYAVLLMIAVLLVDLSYAFLDPEDQVQLGGPRVAISEFGVIDETGEWASPARVPLLPRLAKASARFGRRKPLGAFCGVVILFFVIVGDLVPATINKVSGMAGVGDDPAPYLADQMAESLSFVYLYDEIDLAHRLEGSSGSHLLGTDNLGRDVLSRLLYGARTAVIVAFGATLVSAILQILINVPAAYYGGWYDKIMYRLVDAADSLPTLLVLLVVLGVFGTGLWEMVFVIGTVTGFAGGRPLRGQSLSIMAEPYIEAARVVGIRDSRMMIRYVVPNLMPLIIYTATLRLGLVILLEASISFLGYGIQPPFPSWGQMLSLEGRDYMRVSPGLALYPGIAIGLLVFSFNLWGDAMRDVIDPRLRGGR